MSKPLKELEIVIPVYNEQEIIDYVIESWIKVCKSSGIDFRITAIDDGSKDNSFQILKNLAIKHSELEVATKQNSGHGPTLVQGYLNANAEWIFQVDSDNEMSPDYFPPIWECRNNYDFIIAKRTNRNSPLIRKIVTFISKVTIILFYGSGISSINSPYRLYRKSVFKNIFIKLPIDTFAPNVILSGFACKSKLRIFEVNVPVVFRQTGVVSIKKWKLLKAVTKSFVQTIIFRYKYL